GSMEVEQQKLGLTTSFNAFITRLATSPARSDFQIGVTTTSVDWPIFDAGTSGPITVFGRNPNDAAATPYPAGALVAVDPTTPGKILYDAATQRFTGTRILDASSPTLVADFNANAKVGTDGAGKEQGFRAAKLALTDRIADGTNAGFLRPGARLAIVIVTDEDDCSDPATPPAVVYGRVGGGIQERCHSDADQALLPKVSDYLDFLGTPLAGEVRPVVVAVIAGVDAQKRPVTPSCNNAGYKAVRYKAFVDGLGAQALIDDVCLPDFSPTLESIAGLIAQNVTLSQAPADVRLLQVAVVRRDGTTTPCTVATSGGDAAAADVVYSAPQAGRAPALQFQAQGRCVLQQGDEVRLQILCAG
ncbi:MAG: hypothetical protein ACJ79E_01600, partial [Anaeromyxobacteraceae bacterium]